MTGVVYRVRGYLGDLSWEEEVPQLNPSRAVDLGFRLTLKSKCAELWSHRGF